MAISTPLTELKALTGETIHYQIRRLMGITILAIKTNFHPLDHISFAQIRIASIDGVKELYSISIDKKTSGTYFFGLSSKCDIQAITESIQHEFETYFVDFK